MRVLRACPKGYPTFSFFFRELFAYSCVAFNNYHSDQHQPLLPMTIDTPLLRAEQTIIQLYDELLPKVKKMVSVNQGTEEEALDIFQDALEVIYNRALKSEFSIQSSLEAYVYGICQKMWLMQLRKRGTQHRYTNEVMVTQSSSTSFEKDIDTVQQELLYETYFRQLNERCQQILRLFFQNKSFMEIAKIMGFGSSGYAKKVKFKCKKKLIAQLRADPKFKLVKKS